VRCYRYRVHGNMLYVRHATIKDRGTYRCVVVRPGGRLETADAPLGLYYDSCVLDVATCICTVFH